MKKLFTLLTMFVLAIAAQAETQVGVGEVGWTFERRNIWGDDLTYVVTKPIVVDDQGNITKYGKVKITKYVYNGGPYNQAVIPSKVQDFNNMDSYESVVKKSDVYYYVTGVPNKFDEQNLSIFEAGSGRTLDNMTSISLPCTLADINYLTFAGCDYLEKFVVEAIPEDKDKDKEPDAITQYYEANEDGVLVAGTNQRLVLCPPGKEGEYTIPETVTLILPYAFANCKKLTEVKLPSKISGIYEGTFMGSGITRVNLPDAVKSISAKAFKDCANLKIAFLGRNVESIGASAFKGCLELMDFFIDKWTAPELAAEGVFDESISGVGHRLVPYNVGGFNKGEWANWHSKSIISNQKIYDGDTFDNPSTLTDLAQTRYIRTFTDSNVNKWNALYIPGSINVNDYIYSGTTSGDFDFAEIFTLSPVKDTNDDKVIDSSDDNFLVVSRITSGKTVPNRPYLIRPNQAGEFTFNIGQTISKSEDGAVTCSTTKTTYTVTGVNKATTVTAGDGKYYMGVDGKLNHRDTGSTTVKPNRWIMTASAKTEYGTEPINQAKINIIVLGEDVDEATLIEGVQANKVMSRNIYTLDGRKVTSDLKPGIYVMNGKKYIVK